MPVTFCYCVFCSFLMDLGSQVGSAWYAFLSFCKLFAGLGYPSCVSQACIYAFVDQLSGTHLLINCFAKLVQFGTHSCGFCQLFDSLGYPVWARLEYIITFWGKLFDGLGWPSRVPKLSQIGIHSSILGKISDELGKPSQPGLARFSIFFCRFSMDLGPRVGTIAYTFLHDWRFC